MSVNFTLKIQNLLYKRIIKANCNHSLKITFHETTKSGSGNGEHFFPSSHAETGSKVLN